MSKTKNRLDLMLDLLIEILENGYNIDVCMEMVRNEYHLDSGQHARIHCLMKSFKYDKDPRYINFIMDVIEAL